MTDLTSETKAARTALRRALHTVERDGKPLAPSYCSMLASGVRRPGWDTALDIQEQIGVPITFWLHRKPAPTAARKPQKVNKRKQIVDNSTGEAGQ